VRFDDRMRTVLACASAAGEAGATLFVPQLVDLMAQEPVGDPELSSRAHALLRRLWHRTPPATQREALRLAAAGRPAAWLVDLFLDQPIDDLLPILRSPALGAGLATLVERLPSASFDELRARHDLPLALAAAVRTASRKPAVSAPEGLQPKPSRLAELVGDWLWETDRDARLVHVEGAAPASPGQRLADDSGELAQALARRAPFRHVRLHLGGDWRLCAVPVFQIDGRFAGFRGAASRETVSEGQGLFGSVASTDSFAQMAHEVRTPLNAIMGFAEMIMSETLGPAAEPYRERAGAIVASATRLLGAVEDLADATRLDLGRYAAASSEIDLDPLLTAVADRCRDLAARHRVELVVTDLASASSCLGDEAALRRALDRLVGAALACAESETLLLGRGRSTPGQCSLFLTRPLSLVGMTADELLDASNSGADGPILGIGFALRLAERLVAASGGVLQIEPHRFTLRLRSAEAGIAIAARSA
jgi:signal transduction histidine kinase